MARPFRPGYVTANDLVSGRVIYLATDGAWVTRREEAERIEDQDRAAARLALAETQPGRAVGPYLAPAETGVPGSLREAFRAGGPSAPARVSWGASRA